MGDVKWLEGLREVVDDYDAFIFDLWGVVHNGSVAFPWARECLVELKKLRKPVLFLSNSSRRCATNSAALEKLGIGPDLYVDLITSGEVSWKILAGTCNVLDHVPAITEAKTILTFGNGSDDAEYLKELPYRVADASEADLLLARGCFSLYGAQQVKSANWEDFDRQLQVAAERGVPMLVANPDVVRPDGNDSPMPGRLAQRYRELGGPEAIFVGKPHPEVFQLARERLQEAGVPSSARLCMVGDSVWHDVRGARAAGLDVLMLCSGVHSQALGIDQAPAQPRRPSPESLNGFLGALPTEEMPSYMSAALTWGGDAEVVLCGLACMDIVQQLERFPEADEKVRALQTTWLGGGNAANTACALARLGRSCRLMSKVGRDVLGSSILQGLSDEGVLTDLTKSEGPSAFSTVLVDSASGTRTCVNSPAPEMSGHEMREVLETEAGAASMRPVRLVHLDSRHPEAALALTDAVKGLESPPWITLDAERPREGLEPLLQRCDVLFCSARFPQTWTGKAGLPGALASLLTETATNASMVVATRGDRGSFLLVRKSFVKDQSALGTQELTALGVPVVCCAGSFETFYTLACDAWPLPASFKGSINSTGAGDVFIAGFLHSWLNGRPLAFALANGAYVATQKLQSSGGRLPPGFMKDERLS